MADCSAVHHGCTGELVDRVCVIGRSVCLCPSNKCACGAQGNLYACQSSDVQDEEMADGPAAYSGSRPEFEDVPLGPACHVQVRYCFKKLSQIHDPRDF